MQRGLQVRADSAGCSAKFATACRDRNVGFAVVARSTRHIGAAISRIADDDRRWTPANAPARPERDRPADVAAMIDVVDTAAISEHNERHWSGDRGDRPGRPVGLARRDPTDRPARTVASRRPNQPVPLDRVPLLGHYTDAAGSPVERDAHMRAHAHVEDHICRLKASGLERFPFADLDANRAWMAVVCFAADLVRWFQLLCLAGSLAVAEPKALRWALWHTPARVVRRARRHIVRIIAGWPDTEQLLDAYTHIAAIT